MNRDEYIVELRRRLKYRAVPRQRMDEILAEVKDHLDQSGEEPLESFGPPDRYVAQLVRGRWHTPRFIVSMGAAVGAAMLATEVALHDTEAMVRVSGSQVLTGAAIVLAGILAVMPAVHNWFPRPATRLLLIMVAAGLAGCLAAWVGGTTGWDERYLVTAGRAAGLAVAAGLVLVAVFVGTGPYLVRWLRGRRLAANGDRG